MKTAEQLNNYRELVQHANLGQPFKRIDNLHDAVVKMKIIERDHMEVCEDLEIAMDNFYNDLEKAQASFKKAFDLARQVRKAYREEISPIRHRTMEIMQAESLAFDAEDLDDSLRSIAKHDCKALYTKTYNAVALSKDVMKIVHSNPFEK